MMRFKPVLMGFVCLSLSLQAYSQTPIDVSTLNILAGGMVVASGYDGLPYYIYDGDFTAAFASTKNGQQQDLAYIGVLRNRRMTINRALFYGGTVYEDGGWFDSSTTPVEFQVMVNPGDAWTTAGVVSAYPALNGTDMAAAVPAHQEILYEVTFPSPVSCVGLRIAGKGASGNAPGQSYITINEIQAFGQLGAAVNAYTPPPLDGALPTGSNFRHQAIFEGNGHVEGYNLIDGNPATYVRSEEIDFFDFQAFFGFYSANPLTIRSVSFVHGPLGESGGWFNVENAKPALEIKRSIDSGWEAVGTVSDYPDTDGFSFREDLPADVETKAWTVTLSSPVQAIGVRFIGNGSYNIDEIPFVQCAEITVDADGSPAYNGPVGTGRDSSGNPFKAGADGNIFIEAEFARSINDAYRIFPHGGATNGLVLRGNYGPNFNLFSQQIIEYDFEVTANNTDYFIYTQFDVTNGWTDSVFVTTDDLDPLTPTGVTNDIRWVLPRGTPANSSEVLDRAFIVLDSTLDFWTLDAGVHTLRIGMREPLKLFDWFLISSDPNLDIAAYNPPRTQPPVSVEEFAIY